MSNRRWPWLRSKALFLLPAETRCSTLAGTGGGRAGIEERAQQRPGDSQHGMLDSPGRGEGMIAGKRPKKAGLSRRAPPPVQRKARDQCLASGFWKNPGSDLLSHTVTRAVPSAVEGLTAVFGMGTGVTPLLSPPGNAGAEPSLGRICHAVKEPRKRCQTQDIRRVSSEQLNILQTVVSPPTPRCSKENNG